MEHRHLGRSGLKISEIIYGNWLTHASQVEDDRARACVRAALDAGISTFDTADTYANTAAEVVLGEALKGERRESLEIFTKVYFPTGPKGHNDTGLSRKHIRESIDGSLRRLGTDYVDLYQAHRYDYATPLEETSAIVHWLRSLTAAAGGTLSVFGMTSSVWKGSPLSFLTSMSMTRSAAMTFPGAGISLRIPRGK